MYTIKVFHEGSDVAAHAERLPAASDVLARVPELLKEHAACERVEVFLDATRLFSVDCHGNTIANR